MKFTRSKKLRKTSEYDANIPTFGIASTLYRIDGQQDVMGGHVALIHCLDDELKSFHFTGRDIAIQDSFTDTFWGWYFHYELDLWEDESELDYLMAWFERIQQNNVVRFGYNFDMLPISTVDNGLPGTHITTCVGFAFKVLNSITPGKAIIDVDSWPVRNPDSPEEIDTFNRWEERGMDMEEYLKTHKRIFPLEGLMIAYIDPSEYPVTLQKLLPLREGFNNMLSKLSVETVTP